MVRKGKERASAPDQPEAPETVQDARWLNGVNRQLRPDAPPRSARQPPELTSPAERGLDWRPAHASVVRTALAYFGQLACFSPSHVSYRVLSTSQCSASRPSERTACTRARRRAYGASAASYSAAP